MASRINFDAAPTNGKAKPTKTRATAQTKAEREARSRQAKVRRAVAVFAASVGVALLFLSVFHCTDAIRELTQSHTFLAALLAIGIDLGMIASELAELVAHDDCTLARWARSYVITSIGLSMVLNGYANAMHATTTAGVVWGIALGVIVPALVFMLGKVAGLMAKGA